jgi:hypothetical protein
MPIVSPPEPAMHANPGPLQNAGCEPRRDPMSTVKITPAIAVANDAPFVLFGGINVLESKELALRAAE